MALDNPNKQTGRIYLGVANETTIEGLDAMQAAIRREDWNKNTQELYLLRIRKKATAKAKQILGTGYAERQKIIDEAYLEAKHIKDEAQTFLEQAKQHKEQARLLQEQAQQSFDTSEENGFDSGLNQANDEITAFRIEMGSALLAVVSAIEKQSENIFNYWRDDIVELVHICVEKSTDWVMSAEHDAIIKNLVIKAVKQLLNRRQVNLCVHPDDEETVVQLFNFAKEAMPDIKYWSVSSDPQLQRGDLIAECVLNTLHNKHADRLTMVQNILSKLSLPADATDEQALVQVHEDIEEQKENINKLVPEIEAQKNNPQQENMPTENQDVENIPTENQDVENILPENLQNNTDVDNNQQNDIETNDNKNIETGLDLIEAQRAPMDNNEQEYNNLDMPPQVTTEPNESGANEQPLKADNSTATSNVPKKDNAPPLSKKESNSQALTDKEQSAKEQQDATDKLMADLEQELLPLPAQEYQDFDNTNNSDEIDSVFATGGFVTTDTDKDNS